MTDVPFHKADLDGKEQNAVLRVMQSGWLTSGKEMQTFEEEVSAWMGRGVQSIACSSATAGLHLALEACGVERGDHVLVPTWTFTATAEVVEYVGARPIFVDVDPATMNVTVETLEAARTPETQAVIVVHFAGRACDMQAIWEWAWTHKIMVIEDAAHAYGSWYRGLPIGAGESDATVFSFYATKCITTAEGGMVVTRRGAMASRMRQMRMHGMDRNAFDRYQNSQNWEYDVVAAGFKYNMPDILAAIGRVQLEKMEAARRRREDIAQYYTEALKHLVGVPPTPAHAMSRHLYVVKVPNRNVVITEMAKRGVGCSVHFKPLHKMTYWKSKAQTWSFPGAEAAFVECLSLPIYATLTRTQLEHVVNSLEACLR